MSHGERSASEADAKKDRDAVGLTPKKTALSPFSAFGGRSKWTLGAER